MIKRFLINWLAPELEEQVTIKIMNNYNDQIKQLRRHFANDVVQILKYKVTHKDVNSKVYDFFFKDDIETIKENVNDALRIRINYEYSKFIDVISENLKNEIFSKDFQKELIQEINKYQLEK